jgi:glycosyltransferase involved in cell wall biosynthesis
MKIEELPEDFDWEFYLNHYMDLRNAGLTCKEDAISHYLNFGRYECRIYDDKFYELESLKPYLDRINNFTQDSFEIIKNHNQKEFDISVIISLYNYGKYITDCIDSVISNNFESKEIVIINDCSTDNSLEKVLPYLDSESKITIINKKVNTGLIHSRNLGIDTCSGKYVFILDADNKIYENCLSEHYNNINNTDFIACYGIIECYNEEGKFIKNISDDNFDLNRLNSGNYIDAMAMFNKQKLIEIGKYNIDLMKYGIGWEDYELWLRVGKKNEKVFFIDKPLSFYLVKENSMLDDTNKNYAINLKKYLYKIYS